MSKTLCDIFSCAFYVIFDMSDSIKYMRIHKMNLDTALNAFGENLKRLREENNLTQKELGLIIGQSESSAQPYIAKLEKGKTTKPKLEELLILADHFNISIDLLLGRKNIVSSKLTPRSICKLITELKGFNMHFTTIEKQEECYYPCIDINGYTDICEDKKKTSYSAIYFSNWFPIKNNDDHEIARQIGNDCPDAKRINNFLNRLSDIRRIQLKGNLNDEMYNRLLESYLNDVPDK